MPIICSASPVSPSITLSPASSPSPSPLSVQATTQSPWSPPTTLPRHEFLHLPQGSLGPPRAASMDMRSYTNEFSQPIGASMRKSLPKRKRRSTKSEAEVEPAVSDDISMLQVAPPVDSVLVIEVPSAVEVFPPATAAPTSSNSASVSYSVNLSALSCTSTTSSSSDLRVSVQPPSNATPMSAFDVSAPAAPLPSARVSLPSADPPLEQPGCVGAAWTRAGLPRRRVQRPIFVPTSPRSASTADPAFTPATAPILAVDDALALIAHALLFDGASPPPSLCRPATLAGSGRKPPFVLRVQTGVASDVEILAKRKGWRGVGGERKGAALPRRKRAVNLVSVDV